MVFGRGGLTSNSSGGVGCLSDLGDTTITCPTACQILKYCDCNSIWINAAAGAGCGDVAGPASATDNAIARFNGTTGKVIQNSGVTISDCDHASCFGAIGSNAAALSGTNFAGLRVGGSKSTTLNSYGILVDTCFTVGNSSSTMGGIYVNSDWQLGSLSSTTRIAGIYVDAFAITNGAAGGVAEGASIYVSGAPTGDGGILNYAVHVDGGESRFDGEITLHPFGTCAGNTTEVRFLELAASGTNYVGFKAADALAGNQIWTLPSTDGCACQVIITNGSGVLSFTAAGSGDFIGPACSTDEAIVRFNGAGGKTGQNSGITISDTNVLTLAGDITRAADQSIDLTGAATRTLTILNSTACQVADLDVSDGKILVDTIVETSAAAGVTIDGVLLKDCAIAGAAVPSCHSGSAHHSQIIGGNALTLSCVTLNFDGGAAPAGELGGTWASPTVDATHSGSAHHAAVTLAGCLDYLTLCGQAITRGAVVLTTDVSGILPEANLPDASLTAQGVIEIATAAETTTGTDATRAVSPDGLAGSTFGKRFVEILVHCPNCCCALTTGNGKAYFRVPSCLCGYNLAAPVASVTTVSSSGLPTVQLRKDPICGCDVDVLSTTLTIDACEVDSSTATTAAVVNACNDALATGDKIHIDVDVAGTGTKGLLVGFTAELP